MPYNEELDARIKKTISDWKNTANKKMLGGVCHLLNGNMFCGVHKEFLILRLGKDAAKDARMSPHVYPFDITGKPMTGWVMVSEEGCRDDNELKVWLNKAKDFVKTLPAK